MACLDIGSSETHHSLTGQGVVYDAKCRYASSGSARSADWQQPANRSPWVEPALLLKGSSRTRV